MHWQPVARLDAAVLRVADRVAYAHTDLRRSASFASAVGQPTVWRIAACVVAAVVLFRRRIAAAVAIVGATVLGAVASPVLKDAVGRARPHPLHVLAQATGASFPSGHALGAAVGAVVLTFALPARRFRRVTGAVLAVCALAVATSRLVLCVHYLSDVVAGLALGAAIAVACIAVADGAVRAPAADPPAGAGPSGRTAPASP